MRLPLPLAALALVGGCAREGPSVPPVSELPVAPVHAAHVGRAAPTAPPGDDDAITAAVGDYLELVVAISPETGTAIGDHSRDAELDDYTLDGEAAGLRREEEMLAGLRARFASPRASLARKTDLAVLESAISVDLRLRRTQRPLERLPTAYTEPMDAIFLMAAREYAPAADRARASLARVEKIPDVVALARKNLGAPPKVWVEVGIEEARSARDFFAGDERTFLLGALPGERARIDRDLDAATRAYLDYARFLEHDVLPRAGADFALGRGGFEALLREGYFLDEGPDPLYDLGKRVFDETVTQLDAVAHRIDPKAGSWPDVTQAVKAHHPTAADLIPSYEREVVRARAFLADKDVVPFPPGDDCKVEDTPPFLRSTTTASYEAAPALDPVTRGFFYVTPVDRTLPRARQEEMLRENDHGDQVDTVVHETYPGHHLQLSFARTSSSPIRKMSDAKRAPVLGADLFAEGWGLYAEELMNELGYYSDEERLMQLEWTLVRAARVMIDVGLHTRGMTFDQAVHVLTDQAHLEHELALTEVKRYTMTPTQPLSYLVGRERIRAIRERFKQRAGDAFTLKAFHTALLSHGSIAQGLVEREMFDGG